MGGPKLSVFHYVRQFRAPMNHFPGQRFSWLGSVWSITCVAHHATKRYGAGEGFRFTYRPCLGKVAPRLLLVFYVGVKGTFLAVWLPFGNQQRHIRLRRATSNISTKRHVKAQTGPKPVMR